MAEQPPAAQPASPAAPAGIRVQALARGYYGGIIRDAGDVFEVAAETDLGGWMAPTDPAQLRKLPPERLKALAKLRPAPAGVKPTPAMKLK